MFRGISHVFDMPIEGSVSFPGNESILSSKADPFVNSFWLEDLSYSLDRFEFYSLHMEGYWQQGKYLRLHITKGVTGV